MNLHLLDWGIVAVFLIALLALLIYSQRYIKSAADFLVASRCGGRYLLSIARGAVAIGAVSVVAGFERDYISGFTAGYWALMTTPLALILSVFGWVYYRYRETRVMTLAQLFEMRYSRRFRVFCGIVGWISGLINFGIFPAVGVRFLIYFCGIPESFMLFGAEIETYPVVLAVAIGTGAAFAIFGGQISIMITDFAQGMFLNVAILVMMIFLYTKFDWNDIWTALHQHGIDNPQASMLNPFKTAKADSFNLWFYLIAMFTTIYATNSWQGASGYNAAAKSPHEAKMATIISTWRVLVQSVLFLFIPVCCFAVMNNPVFADLAASAGATIGQIEDPQLQTQMQVPVILLKLLPVGIIGLFTAVMVAAMISTDNTYMHSWGTIFIQDVIMPFKKKHFTQKQHLVALRLSILFVAVFAFFFSYLFKQNDYILMFFAITGSIYIGGAGAVIIGGLYTRKGTVWGAWASMITGIVLSLTGMVIQRVRPEWFYPDGKALLSSQQIYFFTILAAIVMYVTFSVLDHLINRRPDFNLEKMLHRGKYAIEDSVTAKMREQKKISFFTRLLGVTSEFTFWDKVMLYAKTVWIYFWFGAFLLFMILELSIGLTDRVWWNFWRFKIELTFFIGIGTTVWFVIGGIFDTKNMFRALRTMQKDDSDDGTVREEEVREEAESKIIEVVADEESLAPEK